MLIQSRYKVLSELGHGAAATVYLADDQELQRSVAVKLLNRRNEPRSRAGLAREYETLRAISHRNVVEAYDLVLGDNESFLVMEFAGRQTLKHIAEGLSFEEALRVLMVIAETLRDLHTSGWLYCDLKPQNLVIVERELPRIKFVDFDLAKPLKNGRTEDVPGGHGTYDYMSPEQCGGGVLGRTADIYSFGMLAYELLAKQLPYSGTNASEIALSHLMAEAPELRTALPTAPLRADHFIRICLSKEPRDRYQSFEEVLEVLSRVTAPPPFWERVIRYLSG